MSAEKVKKIMSLLSPAERTAVMVGSRLSDAVHSFNKLGNGQKRIAITILSANDALHKAQNTWYIDLWKEKGK